jgi:uncharacterized repeat protein (TIGR03987 family)
MWAGIKISIAWLIYTYAVIGGRKSGLSAKYLVAFALGFLLDFWGTYEMYLLAGQEIVVDFHSLTGIASLLGMGLHAALALAVSVFASQKADQAFHKVSIWIYTLWCLAYFSGLIFHLASITGD